MLSRSELETLLLILRVEIMELQDQRQLQCLVGEETLYAKMNNNMGSYLRIKIRNR